ncbi:hypothetical protein EV359DRAFT_86783 [Lentinula novae-zelandiae]|nr:hypothetical protein EV359DRAFT_86783 [Lentinula novae-zelandiae]
MPPYRFSLQQLHDHTRNRPGPTATTTHGNLSEAAKRAIQSSVTKGTILRRYNYQAHYVDWCEASQLSTKHIIDPSETTLCNYSASFMGKEAGGTVRAKIAVVKNLVSAKGHGWHGGSRLREVLNGVERAAPPSSFCPEREPVKVEWLNMLHDELNASGRTPLNSCVIACADAVFYGQLRLGEVLPQSALVSNYMASQFPLVSDLSIPDKFGQNHSGKLRLPCMKTHQSRGESVILINHNVKSDAVQALTHHLEENRLLPSDPLFSY